MRRGRSERRDARRMAVRLVDITLKGEVDSALIELLDTSVVEVGRGVTRVRVDAHDASVLHGQLAVLAGLGLELLDIRAVAPAPVPGRR